MLETTCTLIIMLMVQLILLTNMLSPDLHILRSPMRSQEVSGGKHLTSTSSSPATRGNMYSIIRHLKLSLSKVTCVYINQLSITGHLPTPMQLMPQCTTADHQARITLYGVVVKPTGVTRLSLRTVTSEMLLI